MRGRAVERLRTAREAAVDEAALGVLQRVETC